MKPHTQFLNACLMLMMLAAMSFAVPKKTNRKTVAFEATYTTTKEVIHPAPELKQKITGEGKSSVLNISRFVAVSMFNTSTTPPFAVTGDCTFYADNGDVFYTHFTGTNTPHPDGTFTVEIKNTIDKGTGQFEHAQGTITGKSDVDPKKPTASIVCNGSITY